MTRACLPRGAGSQLLEGPQGSLSGFPPAGWGIRDIDGQSGKAADAGILAGGWEVKMGKPAGGKARCDGEADPGVREGTWHLKSLSSWADEGCGQRWALLNL